MLRSIAYLILATLLAWTLPVWANANKNKSTTYGQGVQGTTEQNLSSVVDQPEKFLEQSITVTGEIKKVCPMRGCWLDLQDKDSGKKIHVKVKDGDIVFPKDSVGKKATVKGKLVAIKMTKEKAIKFYRHRAKELGENFNPQSITGPMTTYQINGTGAEIFENDSETKSDSDDSSESQ